MTYTYFWKSAALIAALAINALVAFAQAPAPKRDLTGIWDPGRQGIGANGARANPSDGKHDLPFTPKGLAAMAKNKTSNGPNQVSAADENDPAHYCEPQGFPRQNLFELRMIQIVQQPIQTTILYTYDRVWRGIWTDGRALQKDPDPRWFGYSAGKWKDDYTFVVETNGMDDRTWIDNAGRPHSEAIKTTEEFHMVDRDTMELTMTIDDPEYYTKPWLALDKIQFKRVPPNTDLQDMICAPSEVNAYNKRHAEPGAPKK
ncbi:MAG: hypothetical protein ABL967_09930 [Bryobacteraceae bacterium]